MSAAGEWREVGQEVLAVMDKAKKLLKAAGLTMEGGGISGPYNAASDKLRALLAAPDLGDMSDERVITHYATESLVQDLDVLVHGVPTGAGLAALVETLRSRQSVQILKLDDGMRVNFRAPDGRRTTMFLDVVVDDFARTGRTASELARVMRAAIEAYPVAGSTPC